MFIPLKMVLIGIDPYPYNISHLSMGHVPSCSAGTSENLSENPKN